MSLSVILILFIEFIIVVVGIIIIMLCVIRRWKSRKENQITTVYCMLPPLPVSRKLKLLGQALRVKFERPGRGRGHFTLKYI